MREFLAVLVGVFVIFMVVSGVHNPKVIRNDQKRAEALNFLRKSFSRSMKAKEKNFFKASLNLSFDGNRVQPSSSTSIKHKRAKILPKNYSVLRDKELSRTKRNADGNDSFTLSVVTNGTHHRFRHSHNSLPSGWLENLSISEKDERLARCARYAKNFAKRATYYPSNSQYTPTRCYQTYCKCQVSSCRRRCPYQRPVSIYEGKDWFGAKHGKLSVLDVLRFLRIDYHS